MGNGVESLRFVIYRSSLRKGVSKALYQIYIAQRERYIAINMPTPSLSLPPYCHTFENKSSLLELKPLAGFAGAGFAAGAATGDALLHPPKSSSPLTWVAAFACPNPPLELPLAEPQPKPLEADAVVFVVDVVGLLSFQASEEPHASKLLVKLILGDLAADCKGAAD